MDPVATAPRTDSIRRLKGEARVTQLRETFDMLDQKLVATIRKLLDQLVASADLDNVRCFRARA